MQLNGIPDDSSYVQPSASIPPLAGLSTYAQAASVGCGVSDTVARLLRYAWFEKRSMEAALCWFASTPEWEIKEALGLHLHTDALHVDALRTRISEMRNPVPRMDITPDPAIDRFFDEVMASRNSVEKLAGLYGVIKPALLAAYRQHLANLNPVADYPTAYVLKHIIVDEEEAVEWGQRTMAAVMLTSEAQLLVGRWAAHLEVFLAAAGGVMGDQQRPDTTPVPRTAAPFVPDFFPQRDDRFTLRWNFVNPQRQVSLNEALPLDERTLALMCRRIVEMDVPEYMARIILSATNEPWEYYVDMTRQMWDEVRHAMLGTIYFEARGVDWRRLIAIHPGMSIRLLTLHAEDAHTVLYAIEQKLMPGNSGKRLEYEISCNANDPLAAQIQDYDWADEVLHVHIGRKWLLPRLKMQPGDAVERGWALRASTANVLEAYEHLGNQENWWPELVKAALGRESAVEIYDLKRL